MFYIDRIVQRTLVIVAAITVAGSAGLASANSVQEHAEVAFTAFGRADVVALGRFSGSYRELTRTAHFTDDTGTRRSRQVDFVLYEFLVERIVAGSVDSPSVARIEVSAVRRSDGSWAFSPTQGERAVLPLIANAGSLDEGYVVVSGFSLRARDAGEVSAAEAYTALARSAYQERGRDEDR